MADKALGILALAISGVAAYAYLALAGRTLGPSAFVSVGVLWAIVFLLNSALAAPLELAVARAVAAARARREPEAEIIQAALVIAGLGGLLTMLLTVLGADWLGPFLFADQGGLAIAGGAAVAGLLLGSAAKGACAGQDRLLGWGSYLLLDGVVRFGIALAAAAWLPQTWCFAVALAAAPWIALIAPGLVLRHTRKQPFARDLWGRVWGLLRTTTGLAVIAAGSAAVIYFGAVSLPILASAPDARIGAAIAALALARVPLFVVSPLVAIAVPRIAYAVEARNAGDARRSAAIMVGVAAVGGMLVALIGGFGGDGPLVWVFGSGFGLDRGSLMAVGIAGCGWLVATGAAAATIGVGAPSRAAAAWACGILISFTAMILFGPDALVRTDAAVALGAAAAAVAGLAAAVISFGPELSARSQRVAQ